jgi:hypothetical protein
MKIIIKSKRSLKAINKLKKIVNLSLKGDIFPKIRRKNGVKRMVNK